MMDLISIDLKREDVKSPTDIDIVGLLVFIVKCLS